MAWERIDVEREIEMARANDFRHPERAIESALIRLLQEVSKRIETLERKVDDLSDQQRGAEY